MDYATWLTWITTTLQVADTAGTTAFTAISPMIIAYAEGRLYRDPQLDFLATRVTDVTAITATGVRSVAIPTEFIVIESVALVTPANTLPSASGATRIPLLRTTRQFIDLTWPVESKTATPDPFEGGYWSLLSMQEASPASSEDEASPFASAIQIAPTPDDSYRVEITGTQRPQPLSGSNTTTFLTQYLPDLFFAATMIAAAGYQRDYGAQSEDPRLAMSWESLFQELRAGAAVEELRKKALVGGFSSLAPAAATPPAQLADRAAQMG